jgi:hypothetical protein
MSEARLYHLLLHSAGLALPGLLTRAGQPWWQRDASAGYVFSVAVLWAALLLPVVQLPLSGIRPARRASTGPGALLVLREVRVIHRPGEPAAEVTESATERARDSWLCTALGMVYVGGLLAVASFRLLRWWQTRRLLAWCRPVRDPRILALWQDVAAGSPLADRVRLLTCPGLRLPCCGGFWWPYLLIPEADTLSPDNASLPWALRHELVHLERGDARLAALQAVLVTLYWFHPVAWWLARQLDWWREVSCDLFDHQAVHGRGHPQAGDAGQALRAGRPRQVLHRRTQGQGRVYAADYRRYVDEGVMYFVASNMAEFSAVEVSPLLAGTIFGAQVALPPTVTSLPRATLAKYAGRYQLPSGATFDVAVGDGGLRVTGQGQDAVTLLLTGGVADAKRFREVNARTGAIVAALAKRDYHPLHQVFGGRLSLEQVQAAETDTRKQLEGKHGAYQSFTVLGTAPEGDRQVTLVRLNFARGGVLVRYAWGDKTLMGLRVEPEGSPGSLFLPQAEASFVSFRLAPPSGALPASVRLRFQTTPDSTVSALTIGDPGTTAKRVSDGEGRRGGHAAARGGGRAHQPAASWRARRSRSVTPRSAAQRSR